MEAFCQRTIGNRTKDILPNGGYGYMRNPQADSSGNKGMYTEGLGDHYIFHGVESYTPNDDQKISYAGRFAAFITENKLGFIAAGKRQSNRRYHDNHICQVFIWNPDREAVFAWWQEHRPKPVTPDQPKASVILVEADDDMPF